MQGHTTQLVAKLALPGHCPLWLGCALLRCVPPMLTNRHKGLTNICPTSPSLVRRYNMPATDKESMHMLSLALSYPVQAVHC